MSNHNIKSLLTELLQFFVSLPNSKEKMELNIIINMITNSSADLKKILLIIQGNIDKHKSATGDNKTLREKNILFWNHILSIFTKYLRN